MTKVILLSDITEVKKAQFVHHLLHEDPAGEGDGVANGGDNQTIILQHVLEPATVVNMKMMMIKSSRKRKV